ncbi:MAG: hypothetical protein AAFU86_07925 [Pseudomonadota bacterium]
MNYKTLGLICAALILQGPAWAQQSCTDGQVFNPDTGNCEIGNGGGGGDGGGSDDDGDGLTPRLLRFLTPENGDSFASGTEVAPTGRTSLTNVQRLPLDLTVVIDTSQSMLAPTGLDNTDTPAPGDTFNRLELVQSGVTRLLELLPDSAVVTIVDFANIARSVTEKATDINFDGVPDPGGSLTRTEVIEYVNTLETVGNTTNFGAPLTEALNRYSGGVADGFTVETFDRELLFLSDGQPASPNYFSQLNALPFRGVDPLFVSLPGNSPNGNILLQQAAGISGGQFFDFSGDAQGLLNAFENPSEILYGITSLEITNPDGGTYFAETDAFGNFALDPFALNEGNNLFSATALFGDGTSFSETLTLVGTASDAAPVPLPATGWMLLSVMLGGAAWGRRRRA